MKSVRLDPEFEKRVERAAAIRGESMAEFIRLAAAERADATFVPVNADDFDDVIGVVHGGGPRIRRAEDGTIDLRRAEDGTADLRVGRARRAGDRPIPDLVPERSLKA